MKLTDTKHEAVLKFSNGSELTKVAARFDGIYFVAKEMWAVFYPDVYRCEIYFFDTGMDDELFKLGYAKVLKLEKVEIYEERTKIY